MSSFCDERMDGLTDRQSDLYPNRTKKDMRVVYLLDTQHRVCGFQANGRLQVGQELLGVLADVS